MKKNFIQLLILCSFTVSSCAGDDTAPKLAGWDYDHMKEVRKSIKNNTSEYYPAFIRLVRQAEKALENGPYSVTFKKTVPPGGTKNDYMSQGPYWWPDSTKPGGLPYIRRDGIRNPESGIDRSQLGDLISDVRDLSLAWFFTGDNKYAVKASLLLKVWFIDPETKMNPNLEFAQSIPGITTGRGIGIIDIRGFYSLVDAISVLEVSGAITPEESGQIRKWFSDLFLWLTTSSNGKDEDNYFNNHAVAYDVIVSSIATFLNNDEYVKERISQIPGRRIDPMIKADGRQPEELTRTNAFGYSVSNLRNFFDAGVTGLKAGVDIFSYSNPEGGSVRKALDFLIRYIGKESEWKWQQISGWENTENGLGIIIRTAARIYNNQEYKDIWEREFSEKMRSDWSLLVTSGL